MRLMTPPFPAASRPSNRITIRCPLATIQSCIFTSSPCSRKSSRKYRLRAVREASAPAGRLGPPAPVMSQSSRSISSSSS